MDLPLWGTARRTAAVVSAIRPTASAADVAQSVGRVVQATAAPLLPKRSLEAAVGGRTVLVTGASHGIGRAAAEQIGAAGATVLLVARSADELGDAVQAIEAAGGAAHAYPADLSDLDAIEALLERLDADGRAVDVLVNNAARSIRRTVAESYDRFHDYQRTMALNYFGPVRLTLGLLPGMRERRRGHVVNVSTLGVQMGGPRFSAYLASKAALETFSRAAGSECVGEGVRFSVVHMPLVRTPMVTATHAYDRMPAMSPPRAAHLITEALRTQAENVGPRIGALGEITRAASPALSMEVLHAMYRAGAAGGPGGTP